MNKTSKFLSDLVVYTKYANYMPDKKRRQNWHEAVEALKNMHIRQYPHIEDEIKDVFELVHQKKVLPSMRSIQFGGLPIEFAPNRIYNCAYLPIEDIRAFPEILFLLLGGTGVGYSVQKIHVFQLPEVRNPIRKRRFLLHDSIEGWSDSIKFIVNAWLKGKDLPIFDYRDIRPKGSSIKKTGGIAPGFSKLKLMHENVSRVFKQAVGRKLLPIEVHDIICYISDCVLAGGVRSSATIALFDHDDIEMLTSKGMFKCSEIVKIEESDTDHYVSAKFKRKNTDDYSGSDTQIIKISKTNEFEFNQLLTDKIIPWYRIHPQRAMANNSAVLVRHKITYDDFTKVWDYTKEARSGDPGILWTNDPNVCTNPCLSAETLVYVADGRGMVSIKELADKGQDVDVFCYDNSGNLVIKRMRNPRITGYNQPIYKVTLDDGSSIRVTSNHKFRLKHGTYKETKDLKHGDSLDVLIRFEASMKDIFPGANSRSSDYFRLKKSDINSSIAEHTIMASYYHNDGKKLKSGMITHHKDFNSKNNKKENLQIMDRRQHNKMHASFLIGDNNPMAKLAKNPKAMKQYKANMSAIMKGTGNPSYCGISNQELRQIALDFTKSLGRKFSYYEWKAFAVQSGYPVKFSEFRKNELGDITELAKWCASKLGFDYIDVDPRIIKVYQKWLELGYDAEIIDGAVFLKKVCPECNQSFYVDCGKREITYCSHKCAQDHSRGKQYSDEQKAGLINYFKEKRELIAESQCKVYSDLKFNLGRDPKKSEWVIMCKKHQISAEICRDSSPFRYYEDLKESAQSYNHKVVSVEYDGINTVYNGTVDDYHNFFVGGFISKTQEGKDKWTLLNNLQCGEISLNPYTFCNLTTCVVFNIESQEELNKLARAASFLGTLQAGYTDFHYLRAEWKERSEEDSLLGVSMTGVASGKVLELNLEEAALEIKAENERVAKLIGINKAKRTTALKPEGSGTLVSQVLGNGIHPIFSRYFKRNVRIKKHDPVYEFLKIKIAGFINDEMMKEEDGAVVTVPMEAPEGAIMRDESVFNTLERIKKFNKEWIKPGHREGVNTNNVSATVYVKDHEWVRVINWMWENREYYNGITILPYDNGTYKQAPFEEISKEEFEQMYKMFPLEIDFTQVYEAKNIIKHVQEAACMGGSCEINI